MSEAAIETPALDVPAGEPLVEQQPAAGGGEEQSEAPKTPDWEAEVSKWKSMARKHEAAAKANAEAARKYAEFEESQKTEQQRLADRLAAAERERDQAHQARAKLLAAATYGIPAGLLDRIGGSSEEEINESAQAIAQEIEAEVAKRLAATPPPAPAPASTGRPVEALRPGAAPGPDTSDGSDPNAWIRQQLGGRR